MADEAESVPNDEEAIDSGGYPAGILAPELVSSNMAGKFPN
jgi:hypothetical protein